jgi:hypothetical protein
MASLRPSTRNWSPARVASGFNAFAHLPGIARATRRFPFTLSSLTKRHRSGMSHMCIAPQLLQCNASAVTIVRVKSSSLRIDAIALSQRPLALLTMLYRSTDCLSCRGAPVKNLAHSASFHSTVKIVPSNIGTEHIGYDPSPVPKTMGERLLAYRRRNGLSRKALSIVIGADEVTLWRWENNQRKPGCPQHLVMLRFLKAGCRPQIHYHQCPTG